MLRNIRITDPAKTYVIADPHFNHRHPEIFRRRGVSSREEVTAQAIERWNAVVPKDATVFVLGDLCLHDPDGSVTRNGLRALNGKVIHLLWGNHNSGMKKLYREILTRQFFRDRPAMANNYEVYPLRATIGAGKDVVFVGETVDLLWRQPNKKDLRIVCAHYAQRTWLHAYRGTWMLCGHSHGNDAGTGRLDDTGLGKILEVSYEVIGRPRNLLEIAQIMAVKQRRAHDVAIGEDEEDE